MSESVHTPPPPAPAAPVVPPPVATRSVLSIVAISLAGLALVLAFVAAGVAWLPAIAAIVLAIVALVKKAQPRLLAILALVVAPIAWLIAIIVAVVSVASGIGAGIDAALDDAPPAVEQPAEEPAAEAADAGTAALGETVTNSDGVAVTFQSVTCGIATAGPQYFEETAKGQFCEVAYNVHNGGDEQISLWASDITGEIGGVEYESNTTISTFGGDMFTTDLNPGLGTDAIVYIDIPADATLEFVVYDPQWSFFTEALRVSAS